MDLPEPVAGVRWRPGAERDVDVLARVQAAADRVDEPLHVATPSEVAHLLANVDPARHVVLGERGGAAVAMGVLFRPGDGPVRLRGAVVPEARGAGIGRALLTHQIGRAAVVHPDAPAIGLRSIGAGGVAALARRAGFEEARHFLEMRSDPSRPVAAVALVDDLRESVLDPALDEPVRVAKNAAFRDHWQGHEDDPEQWRARQLGRGLDRDLCRIALDRADAVAGFVLVHRSAEHPRRAHVPLVGTVREHRGRGVASALLASAMRAAAAAGITELDLGVDAENPTGALRVYERLGFAAYERSTVWQRDLA